MSAIAQRFENIVGSGGVQPWDSLDEVLQRAFRATNGDRPLDCIVYPDTQEALMATMACAYRDRLRVLPWGRGSKLTWGGLADRLQVGISTARLNRLVEHAVGDLTVTAEAGASFADVQATLHQQRQQLGLDPLYPNQSTLGGLIATADTGALRQRYGGVRDMLIGISFVRADGQLAHAGGRVVKNVAGYDLMKLFTGSYGTLGILSQVTFRVYPLPEASQTIVLTGVREALAQIIRHLVSAALTPSALELIPPQTAIALSLGKQLSLVVRFQSIAVSVERQTEQLLQAAQAVGLTTTAVAMQDEAQLWDGLRSQLESSHESSILCKLGVLPASAAAVLDSISTRLPLVQGTLHGGSGLGMVRFSSEGVRSQTLLDLRKLCQSHGGFLTVLEAPVALKQQFDVWGYTGNALHLMTALKTQFDPEGLLSSHRFVGGL